MSPSQTLPALEDPSPLLAKKYMHSKLGGPKTLQDESMHHSNARKIEETQNLSLTLLSSRRYLECRTFNLREWDLLIANTCSILRPKTPPSPSRHDATRIILPFPVPCLRCSYSSGVYSVPMAQ